MIFTVLGSLGGVVTFIGAVILLLKGIVRNVDATKDNTIALNKLNSRLDNMQTTVNGHGADIQSLKDWRSEVRPR